jgi:cyclophilin family peptidyl-prolyl cis-trans isomerase/Skp family chaperone for outer membrane proteins
MRRGIAAWAAVLAAVVCGAAQPPAEKAAGERPTVAVVNLQRVLFLTGAGKELVEEINALLTKKEGEINARMEKAVGLRNELKAKDRTLTAAQKDDLGKQASALEAKAEKIRTDTQRLVEQIEKRTVPQLQQEAARLIRDYAQEKGFLVVIDSSPGGPEGPPSRVLYTAPGVDITEEIVKRMEKFKFRPADGAAAGPGSAPAAAPPPAGAPAAPAAVADLPRPAVQEDLRPQVLLQTSLGDIVVELDRAKAPVTVANFLKYVEARHYDGTIFHRVVKDFVVQGGGHLQDLTEKPTGPPIKNEAKNGLPNKRGTIAMARESAPDTATAQFYINVVDNDKLNYQSDAKPGYAVFGRVVKGMDVVDKMRTVAVTARQNKAGERMENVPVEPIVLKAARRLMDNERVAEKAEDKPKP